MHKFLIILVAIMLLTSLYFTYDITDSFSFLSNKLAWIGTIGSSVAEISGMDTNGKIPYFLPNLNSASLGSYYDENTGKMFDVKDVIKSYLPTWLKVANPDNCKVQVYNTFYSAEFVATYTEWIKMQQIRIDNTVYTINRLIRLGVTYYDYTGKTYEYDLYIYKNPKTYEINYFCTRFYNGVGYNSTSLNLYADMVVNNHPSKLLNTRSRIQLRPDITNSKITTYVQDSITKVQDTTDPLWIDLSDFI